MSLNEIPGVQKPVVRHARRTGWVAWKMKIEGINGCPDYWFFKAGMLLIIEFKKPGKDRVVQQVRRADELGKQGFRVCVVDDPDVGRDMLDNPTQYANVLF